MKAKPKAKPKEDRKGRQYGTDGFRYADGMTPRQKLEHLKAVDLQRRMKREDEHWQTRADAEQAARETAEIIQSDLYGTIPLALAGKLSGRAFTPGEVRAIVRAEVDSAVRNWVKGGRVPLESIVPLETAPQ
jgi:hypothetical protein